MADSKAIAAQRKEGVILWTFSRCAIGATDLSCGCEWRKAEKEPSHFVSSNTNSYHILHAHDEAGRRWREMWRTHRRPVLNFCKARLSRVTTLISMPPPVFPILGNDAIYISCSNQEARSHPDISYSYDPHKPELSPINSPSNLFLTSICCPQCPCQCPPLTWH